jgi:hypothetical protein
LHQFDSVRVQPALAAFHVGGRQGPGFIQPGLPAVQVQAVFLDMTLGQHRFIGSTSVRLSVLLQASGAANAGWQPV